MADGGRLTNPSTSNAEGGDVGARESKPSGACSLSAHPGGQGLHDGPVLLGPACGTCSRAPHLHTGGDMRSRNLAVDIKAAREACPMVPRDVAEPLAERARLDAMDLVTDVRDLDPQQVWGRLVLWGRSEPARLIAATVALAAMVDPDMPVSDLLAWCEPLRGAA